MVHEGIILKEFIRNKLRIKAKELARRGAEKSRKSVDASYSFLRRTFEKDKLDQWELEKLKEDFDIDFQNVLTQYKPPKSDVEQGVDELMEENARLKEENSQLKAWIDRLLNLLEQRDENRKTAKS